MVLRHHDGICVCALLQLTAPSQDLLEVQDPEEREGTQDPKEIKVLVKKQSPADLLRQAG